MTSAQPRGLLPGSAVRGGTARAARPRGHGRGGYGTFEELCEVVTWSQLGLHPKACGLLDVEGYYDPLLALFDRAVEEGFVRREHREIVIVERDPEALLDRLARHRPTHSEKWIARGEE